MGSLRQFCQYFEIFNFLNRGIKLLQIFFVKKDSANVPRLLRIEAIFKKIYRRKREIFTVN